MCISLGHVHVLDVVELLEADGAEEEWLGGCLRDGTALVHGTLEVVAVGQPKQVTELM